MAKKVYEQAGAGCSVAVTCSVCQEDCIIEMTDEQYSSLMAFQSGAGHIQTMLPDVPKAVREMFLSGICPDCWKKLFG